MAGIDEGRTFYPLNIAVLTVSDTRSLAEDTSGDLLVARLTAAGHTLADRVLLRDDVAEIQDAMRGWIADDGIDVVISTGGTGFSPRDVTPEAVRPLFDKDMDGFKRGVPSGQHGNRRPVHPAIPRVRGAGGRHVHLLPAGFNGRVYGCVGSYFGASF